MNSIVSREKLTPCGYNDILGCQEYNTKSVVCMTANGDNNFLNEGIVEGSILFIDTNQKYAQGQLNVFKYRENTNPQYRLSRTKVKDATFFGIVLLAINQYN